MKKILLLALAALPILNSAQNIPAYVPTNGLAAWYSFTGNANDDSGGGNNGIVNGATPAVGKQSAPNTAYAFNGISNTIDLPNPFLGGVQVNAFTFHTLINVTTTNIYNMIWSKTLFWGEVSFDITNQNEIRFAWANSITGNKYSSIYSMPNVIQAGQWYDIVIVFQNSNAQIYLNANPILTNLQWMAQGGSIISTTQIEASCNFAQNSGSSKIGSYLNGSYLNGIIDEFGVWSVALTPSQITNLYLGQNCQTSITSQPTNQNVIAGNAAQFNITSNNSNANYQWQQNSGTGFNNLSNFGQFSGVNSASLSISNVTSAQNNNGYRCVINTGICSDTSNIAVLNVSGVGISEQNSFLGLQVFPNPTRDYINVFVIEKENKTLTLLDASGRSVRTFHVSNQESQLSLEGLESGIYFLSTEGEYKAVKRIVKE